MALVKKCNCGRKVKFKIHKNISDGYHTFDELYTHRTALFAALCNSQPEKAYKAKKHEDGTMYDDMFLASFETPGGVTSYHCKMEFWDWFQVEEREFADHFDGYTPDDVVVRLVGDAS